ncbi:hypothetical protein [Spirochaeta lutea]|uniref:Uncharacterized protein n=1 Tax=Spirochaeta lutea TaxID=1480694 RepID=A0A098R297_9SPIO|nr:hypothetical protein [Spirochaeta lutea]KGE73886.1 hypothetical protein DC28_01405 [Spirochaeta lutea]
MDSLGTETGFPGFDAAALDRFLFSGEEGCEKMNYTADMNVKKHSTGTRILMGLHVSTILFALWFVLFYSMHHPEPGLTGYARHLPRLFTWFMLLLCTILAVRFEILGGLALLLYSPAVLGYSILKAEELSDFAVVGLILCAAAGFFSVTHGLIGRKGQ